MISLSVQASPDRQGLPSSLVPRKTISVDLNGPVWDGNLWGQTFAAMPLSTGASLTLPAYQYESGLGMFYIDVQR